MVDAELVGVESQGKMWMRGEVWKHTNELEIRGGDVARGIVVEMSLVPWLNSLCLQIQSEA